MGRITQIGLILTAAILVHCGHAEAGSRGRHVSASGQYSFQIEAGGASLPTYRHRGQSYVEGTMGEYYQIRVFNHTNERVEAVVTVDGRDVVSGQIGNYRQNRGYVIAPYSSVLIDGFRTSWQQVAAFRFTEKSDSYAARMGDSQNVGVIGVAIFRENRPSPPQPIIEYRGTAHERRYKASRPPAASSDAAEGAPAELEMRGKGSSGYHHRSHSQSLGTQYGDETYSPSSSTKFERRNRRRPDAMLAIRYDDYHGLVHLGVLPRPEPHYRDPEPEPFPGSPRGQFAPPPPPYYWD